MLVELVNRSGPKSQLPLKLLCSESPVQSLTVRVEHRVRTGALSRVPLGSWPSREIDKAQETRYEIHRSKFYVYKNGVYEKPYQQF